MPLPSRPFDVYETDTGYDFSRGASKLLAAKAELEDIKKVRTPTQADLDRLTKNYGTNMGTVSKGVLGGIGSALGSVAKVAGSVVSYVPGVGTAVGAGLKVAGAGLQGQNIAKAAVDAVKTSVPYVGIASAGLTAAKNIAQGKNVLRSVGSGIQNAAMNVVPGAQQAVNIANTARNIAKGQNVLRSVGQGAVNAALTAVPAARQAANIANTAKNIASGQNVLRSIGSGTINAALAAVPGASSVANIARNLPMPTALGIARPNLRPLQAVNAVLAQRPTMGRGRLNFGGVQHVPLSGAAKSFVRARAGLLARDAAGLTSDGKWQVTKGDTGSSIAKALTGDANRWTELKAVNPTLMKNRAAQVKQYGFPIYVNDVINLPAGWVKTTTTTAAKATPVQSSTQSTAPMGATPITTAIQTVQTVLAPAGDGAAQAAARATLTAWSKTDGITSAGVSDYGSATEATATSWTARDKLQAASFQSWANSRGLSSGATTGDWTQELANALRSWAEQKATQVLTPVRTTVAQQSTNPPATTTPAGTTVTPTITLPTTMAIPTNVVTPSVAVTPGAVKDGQITLPGITITPGTASAGTQAEAEKPSYWAQNKPQLISGAVGLVAALGAKFIR